MKKLFLLLFSVLAFTSQVRAGVYVAYQPTEPVAISNNVGLWQGVQLDTKDIATFYTLSKDDVINIRITNVGTNFEFELDYKKGEGWDWTKLNSASYTDGVISYTVESAEMANLIKERGLIIQGIYFKVLDITVTDNNSQLSNTLPLLTGQSDLGNWNKEVSLKDYYDFSTTEVGDVLEITYTSYSTLGSGDWATIQLQSNTKYGSVEAWNAITDKCSKGTQLTNKQETLSITVDETILTALKNGYAIIKGGNVILNSVTISSSKYNILIKTLISDDCNFGEWSGYYQTNNSNYFTYAKSGDILSIAYSVEGNGGELQLIDTNNWQKYSDKYAVSGLSGTGTTNFIINDALLAKLQAGNIVIKGAGNITGKGVSLKMLATPAGYRPVYIPASGYATFYGASTCALPDGVEAYYVSETTTETAKLTSISNIPAGQGVILKGSEGIYQLYTTADAAASAENNKLDGSTSRQQITDASGKYVLYNNGGTPEFRKITENTYLDAFKCYLNAPGIGSKLNIVFAEDENKQDEEQQGETNSIRNIANTNVNNNVVYNMNGQRVGSDYKGLVIVNGKKIIKK